MYVPVPACSPGAVCPEGWQLFDDYCVAISSTSLDFGTAKLSGCKSGTFWADPYLGLWISVKSATALNNRLSLFSKKISN
jgi:hypothetical protein